MSSYHSDHGEMENRSDAYTNFGSDEKTRHGKKFPPIEKDAWVSAFG